MGPAGGSALEMPSCSKTSQDKGTPGGASVGTRADVARLHHDLRHIPYEANRCLEVISRMFNLAGMWGLRPDGSNPRKHHGGVGLVHGTKGWGVIESKPKNGYSGNPVDRVTNIKILSLSATSSGTMDLSKFMYLDEDIPLDATCRAGVATSVFSAAIQKSSSEQQQFSMWMTRQSAKRAASSSCRWPDRQKDMPARSMNCRNVSEHCCGLPTTTIRPPGALR